MNYLEALKTLAKYTDPQSADAYDSHIHAIGFIIVIGKRLSDPFDKPGQLPLDEVVITDRFA